MKSPAVVALIAAWSVGCGVDAAEADLEPATAVSEAAMHSGTTVWVRHLDSAPWSPRRLAVDANGNTIFVDSMPVADGTWDIRISKFGATGRTLWDRTYRSLGNEGVGAIATDADRNIVVVGSGAVTFGCAANVDGARSFVAKLDPTGRCLWVKPLLTQSGIAAVAVDRTDGDIVVLGSKRDRLDLGDGVVLPDPDEANRYDWLMFAARLDAGGHARWARQFPGQGENGESWTSTPVDIGVDGTGSAVITGYFNRQLDLGGGFLTAPVPANPGWSRIATFLGKLDRTGGHVWSHAYGESALPSTMNVDGAGNIALGGRFRGTIRFQQSEESTQYESMDLYVAKILPDGRDLWVKHMWGGANMSINGVGLDSRGSVAVFGAFAHGSFHLGPNEWTNEHWGSDLFVARLGADFGTTVWARRIGEGSTYTNRAGGLAITSDDRIVTVGTFRGTVDFGGTTLVGTTASGQEDGFLARWVR